MNSETKRKNARGFTVLSLEKLGLYVNSLGGYFPLLFLRSKGKLLIEF